MAAVVGGEVIDWKEKRRIAQQICLADAKKFLLSLRRKGLKIGLESGRVYVERQDNFTAEDFAQMMQKREFIRTLLRIEQLESSAKQDKSP